MMTLRPFLRTIVAASGGLVFAAAAVAVTLAAESPDLRYHNDFLGPETTLPDGRKVNASAQYWNDVVGVAFKRDATLELSPTPADLDLDGKPDATFSGRWELLGGLLGNPRLAGFVPTPDDPAGTVGQHSVSTGFLGVREELDPLTRRGTGRFGFNCWVCHGSADERGRITLGLPNTNINLGLIMASSRALDESWVIRERPDGPPLSAAELARREGLDGSFTFDANGDGQVTIAEWRKAMSMPPAHEVQAQLMLAGPGRLDQSVDHRMDGMIPLANLQHHSRDTYGAEQYLRTAHATKRAIFNPVSIPGTRAGLGVAHYSWSGKDSAMREDAVDVLTKRLDLTPDALADLLRLPHNGPVDSELLQRALTLDFRNVATAGRETDMTVGVGWPHKMLTAPDKTALVETPALFDAVRLRELLLVPPEPTTQKDNAELVARGRKLFTERKCGQIINQRVVAGREARTPETVRGIAVLAPLDRSQPLTARIDVRCASCHNYSPTPTQKPIPAPPNDMQRCDLCHFDHRDLGEPTVFRPLAEHMRLQSITDYSGCLRCHATHPDFGAQVYSNSWLLPFDANGNGATFHDEVADAAAGGIGVDAYLNGDTNFSVQMRPAARRPDRMYLLSDNARTAPEKAVFSRAGYGWVRVAPLYALSRTAPYLHNGSVPTLDALLAAPAQRPRTFAVGLPEQKFTYDTALPGNGNTGHDYGSDWSAEDKATMAAFLRSLP